MLPPGYVRDGMGAVVKDPDRRVRQAVELVFRRFRETWSVRQTFTWFHDEGIDVPVNKSTGGVMRLVWRPPTHAFIADMLHNPFYAGAYVFGRRPVEIILSEGRLIRRQRSYALTPEACSVFLRDHHAGYIGWDTYEENVRMIRGNAHWGRGDEAVASIRAGQGLLAGVLRCGRRLHVRYWGKSGTSARGHMTRAASGTAWGSAAARWTSASARSCCACSRRWACRPVWPRWRSGAREGREPRGPAAAA